LEQQEAELLLGWADCTAYIQKLSSNFCQRKESYDY